MELEGRIDEQNLLWTEITVRGTSKSQKIEAMIDTGFNGELCISIQTAVQLGLTLAGTGLSELADGSVVNQLLFTGEIEWGSVNKTITIIITESGDALIGGGLLHGYVLVANFAEKILAINEPNVDEPSPIKDQDGNDS